MPITPAGSGFGTGVVGRVGEKARCTSGDSTHDKVKYRDIIDEHPNVSGA